MVHAWLLELKLNLFDYLDKENKCKIEIKNVLKCGVFADTITFWFLLIQLIKNV